jgi:hypothetical protein
MIIGIQVAGVDMTVMMTKKNQYLPHLADGSGRSQKCLPQDIALDQEMRHHLHRGMQNRLRGRNGRSPNQEGKVLQGISIDQDRRQGHDPHRRHS